MRMPKFGFSSYLRQPMPLFTFADFQQPDRLVSVGIDLTGSEKKPSGWCFLKGKTATTYRLRTDEELVAHTVAARPAVISIDAPLSLPLGRLSVFDEDPGRQEFGITRHCERQLLQRGIRSYPPLIKSMQHLTQRGMALAQLFRAQGYPVIEGYPGGAQDILGVPRKSKSLPLLIAGLAALGLEGAFTSGQLSHDELDAITAALVGHFYLDGQFEALGDARESYLIIPKLPTRP